MAPPFLEDVALAHTWLERNGSSPQSLADYLLMLRYWDERAGRPPKPLPALCIPANAWDNRDVADRATRVFDSAAVFALLHECGHVFHRHNAAVPPDKSRAQEQEADRFALDLLARVGEVPLGVAVLFFTMAHLQEEVARTHPVSPDRLMSVAQQLSSQARSFERGLRPGAQVTMMAISLQVSQFALLLGDPDIQRLSAKIGRTVTPDDLAPRPKGRHLAAPCGSRPVSRQPFDGKLSGTLTGGTTPLDVDVVLSRNGDSVTGSYSFGAGFARALRERCRDRP
jgi:Peptidase U49